MKKRNEKPFSYVQDYDKVRAKIDNLNKEEHSFKFYTKSVMLIILKKTAASFSLETE